jgi:hypothetical protein
MLLKLENLQLFYTCNVRAALSVFAESSFNAIVRAVAPLEAQLK